MVRRERQGASHGISIRVARGLYYRPSAFRSQAVEWEETVHADTGMLGLTTKHIHFAVSRKRFRARYDRIVASGPYEDGLGRPPSKVPWRTAASPSTRRTPLPSTPTNWRGPRAQEGKGVPKSSVVKCPLETRNGLPKLW